MTAPVITLLAEKGGVGRTTLALNLAGAFVRHGLRVLLVDMEGQASLSKLTFGPQIVEGLPLGNTTAAIFDDRAVADPRAVIQSSPWSGISVAPSNRLLADFDFPRPQTTGALQYMLRDFLEEAGASHDVVIIDTPPKIQGLLGWSACVAADVILCPVQPEPFAVQAVVEVQRQMLEAQTAANPRLQHLGYVVTLKRRQALHTATEKMLRQTYQGQVLKSVVQCTAAYAEANACRVPITSYQAKTKTGQKAALAALDEIEALSVEIETRLRAMGISLRTTTKHKKAS